jgi:putative Mg2+ transporter-C (MgtC) family protein
MIPPDEIVIRLFIGALIGGIIGFEREIHGRAAGFRTQLIVCIASVLIMIVSENYYFHIGELDSSLRIDPARISAGALIGIGFLGAGVIIKSGYAVRGLTTAASIWIVSAIGLAIGSGLYLAGTATAILTVIALMALRVVEKRIKGLRFKSITVTTPVMEDAEETIASIITKYNFNIHALDYEKNKSTGEFKYHFTISTRNRWDIKQLFLELSALEFINSIKIYG